MTGSAMVAGNLLPFEFFIAETPRALGASARSRQRWIGTLRRAARRRTEELVELVWLEERPLALSLFYFPPAAMEGDVDNIIKPITDALVGVVYLDDRQVERIVAQKFEPDVDWSFDRPSEVLSAALDAEAPVVYIRVDDDVAWRRN